MKHEFKPGDPVMVPGNVIEVMPEDVLIKFGTICTANVWMPIENIHPIPTPPRPLRVDELVKGEKYTFNRCGETIAGQFTGLIVGENAILEVCNNAGKPYGANVDESQNIRPVERVVSDVEIIKKWNEILLPYYRNSSVDEQIIQLVRHFMKGGTP